MPLCGTTMRLTRGEAAWPPSAMMSSAMRLPCMWAFKRALSAMRHRYVADTSWVSATRHGAAMHSAVMRLKHGLVLCTTCSCYAAVRCYSAMRHRYAADTHESRSAALHHYGQHYVAATWAQRGVPAA